MGSVVSAAAPVLGSVMGGGQSLLGQFGGTGSNAGLFGTGQFHSDPYSADAGAFAPDAAESDYIKLLQNQANGNVPSLADLQMKQGLNQALSQSNALAASQRGINPALAARMAAQSQANMSQQANAQGAQMRAQENMQGLNALGQELNSVRKGREDYQALASGNYNANNNTNAQAYEGAGNRRQNFMQGIGSMMGGMGSMFGGAAHGGMIQRLAMGGPVMMAGSDGASAGDGGTGSFWERVQANYAQGNDGKGQAAQPQQSMLTPQFGGAGGVSDDFATQLAMINQMASKGMQATPLKQPKQSGGSSMMSLLPLLAAAATGGKVPGKANVKGDDKANDTVPTMLSPGEIVIPRTVVAKGPDAIKTFAAAVIKQNGKKGA
jgi:hypothetical protein